MAPRPSPPGSEQVRRASRRGRDGVRKRIEREETKFFGEVFEHWLPRSVAPLLCFTYHPLNFVFGLEIHGYGCLCVLQVKMAMDIYYLCVGKKSVEHEFRYESVPMGPDTGSI
jgi:hypothetical protein